MSALKHSVSLEEALSVVQRHYTTSITDLAPVSGGEVAQVFGFTSDGRAYILRFNPVLSSNFQKERFIIEHFATPAIPIPTIYHIGTYRELVYAISERVEGIPLSNLFQGDHLELLPQLIETLDAIHSGDVRGTTGYGVFDDRSIGLYPSWRASLTAIMDEEEDWNFYGKWHKLFDETFLERDFFDMVYGRLLRYVDFCPEERYLVHGDYGYGNLLARDGRIVAVLDWNNAKYGDFIYDVAWLNFWSEAFDFAATFRQHYADTGVALPNFTERLLCYTCSMGLDALRFYAKTNQKNPYLWAKHRLTNLLGLKNG